MRHSLVTNWQLAEQEGQHQQAQQYAQASQLNDTSLEDVNVRRSTNADRATDEVSISDIPTNLQDKSGYQEMFERLKTLNRSIQSIESTAGGATKAIESPFVVGAPNQSGAPAAFSTDDSWQLLDVLAGNVHWLGKNEFQKTYETFSGGRKIREGVFGYTVTDQNQGRATVYIRTDISDDEMLYTSRHELGHAIVRLLQNSDSFIEDAKNNVTWRQAFREISRKHMGEAKWFEIVGGDSTYINDTNEHIANAIAEYFDDPEWLQRNHPEIVEYFRERINDDPVIGRIVNFW